MSANTATHDALARFVERYPILYHGSRGGIAGDISPTIGRPRTDFGQGFYMGTDNLHTKGLVIHDQQPMSYALEVDFSGIDPVSVLVLGKRDWAYTVLHNRQNCPVFNGSSLDARIAAKTGGFDFIIGPIADDRMNVAVKAFADGALTDEGLMACLARVPYGMQIVAKTPAACKRIDVISEQVIYEREADDIIAYRQKQREIAEREFERIKIEYRNRGKLLAELVAETDALPAVDHDADRSVLMFADADEDGLTEDSITGNAR